MYELTFYVPYHVTMLVLNCRHLLASDNAGPLYNVSKNFPQSLILLTYYSFTFLNYNANNKLHLSKL